ncbi:hypothetical protein BDV11DRAFT_179508 [Aspergillus similis]
MQYPGACTQLWTYKKHQRLLWMEYRMYSVLMLKLLISMFHIVLQPTALCACLLSNYFQSSK